MRQLISVLAIWSLFFSSIAYATPQVQTPNAFKVEYLLAQTTTTKGDTEVDYSKNLDYVGDKHKVGKTQQVFSWLMVLASVALLPTMMVLCAQKIEIAIIIAASLVLIIGEIAIHALYKSSASAEFKLYENKDSDKQKQAINAAIKQTEWNRKIAIARSVIHFAWAAAMTAAGILAIVSHAKDMALTAASCLVAAAACAAACAPTAGACPRSTTCTSGDTGKTDPFNGPKNPLNELQLYSESVKDSPSDLHSYFLIDEKRKLSNNEIKSENIQMMNNLFSNDPTGGTNKIKTMFQDLKKNLAPLSDLIIPNAYALDMTDFKKDDIWKEVGPMIGLTVAGVAALIGLAAAVAKQAVPLASLNGIARGVLWNVLAAFGYTSGSLSAVTAVNLNKDKEAYQDLLKKLEFINKTTGVSTSSQSYKQITGPLALNFRPGDPKLAAIQKQVCSNEGSKTTGSYFAQSGACKCSGNKCSVSNLKTNYGGNFTPPIITNAAGSTQDGFQSAINGNMDGAQVANSEMGSYATKLKDQFANMKRNSNEQLKKLGVPPMDHNKMENEIAASIGDAGRNAIQNLPEKQRTALLNYANGTIPETSSDKEDEDVDSEAAKAAALAMNASGSSAGSRAVAPEDKDKKKGMNFFDFLKNEDKKKKGKDIDSMLKKQTENMKNYQINTQDISKKKSDNIFKIIQYRYFKSAYPILLKRKK